MTLKTFIIKSKQKKHIRVSKKGKVFYAGKNTDIIKIPINKIEINFLQFDQASRNITYEGQKTTSTEQIEVSYNQESGKYKLHDGYHRLVRAIDNKEKFLYAKLLNNQEYKINWDLKSTGIIFYDAFLKNESSTGVGDYKTVKCCQKEYKDLVGKIKYMSPDEFLERTLFLKNNRLTASELKEALSQVFGDKESAPETKEYVDLMRKDKKFNIPFLDYTDNSSEGMHRVFAAKKIGAKEIPVLIVEKFKKNPFPDPEIMGEKRRELISGNLKNSKRVTSFNRKRS